MAEGVRRFQPAREKDPIPGERKMNIDIQYLFVVWIQNDVKQS